MKEKEKLIIGDFIDGSAIVYKKEKMNLVKGVMFENGSMGYILRCLLSLTLTDINCPITRRGYFSDFDKDTSEFYWYGSIAPNKIYGRFINFLKNDGYCCPSVIKPVIIDFNTRKVIHMGENIAKE